MEGLKINPENNKVASALFFVGLFIFLYAPFLKHTVNFLIDCSPFNNTAIVCSGATFVAPILMFIGWKLVFIGLGYKLQRRSVLKPESYTPSAIFMGIMFYISFILLFFFYYLSVVTLL